MNLRLILPVVVFAGTVTGCARTELPAPTAENTRSSADRGWTTTTAPSVPRMEPVAGLGGGGGEVWTTCDHGHRIYVVFQPGQLGGITAVDDPTCPAGTP